MVRNDAGVIGENQTSRALARLTTECGFYLGDHWEDL